VPSRRCYSAARLLLLRVPVQSTLLVSSGEVLTMAEALQGEPLAIVIN
jgi:hypothetical protein